MGKDPGAALAELRSWFSSMQRATELGLTLPDVQELHRGALSIYQAVFADSHDPGLQFRWQIVFAVTRTATCTDSRRVAGVEPVRCGRAQRVDDWWTTWGEYFIAVDRHAEGESEGRGEESITGNCDGSYNSDERGFDRFIDKG